MKRKALIKDGKVTDMIIAGDDYKPPAGFRLIEALDANIGDLFVNDRFTRPRIKSSRDDLLRVARIRRSLTSNWSFVFELESGEKVQVPADISARQDLLEIASLGIDSKFLFLKGRAKSPLRTSPASSEQSPSARRRIMRFWLMSPKPLIGSKLSLRIKSTSRKS